MERVAPDRAGRAPVSLAGRALRVSPVVVVLVDQGGCIIRVARGRDERLVQAAAGGVFLSGVAGVVWRRYSFHSLYRDALRRLSDGVGSLHVPPSIATSAGPETGGQGLNSSPIERSSRLNLAVCWLVVPDRG